MSANKAELTFKELSIGMTVRKSQLNKIYDKQILLNNVKKLPDGDAEGIIVYIDGLDIDTSQFYVPGGVFLSGL